MERDQETSAIIAAALEVHNTLGHGFLEAVYQHALGMEFALRGIPHRAQIPMPVFYKEVHLECGYRGDFLCFESVLVELKAQAALS